MKNKVNSPIVSICIPTYGRIQIMKNTIDSIYNQEVDNSLFEVCISDNSPTDETKEMLETYFKDKTNLIYNKSICEGYYNSIEALKLGKGKFLKLHNNYTMFRSEMLETFIKMIDGYLEQDCVIFNTFGAIEQLNNVGIYSSFNEFINCITYFSTWSTSFGIWKKDFDLICDSIDFDTMFPHTSLLFSQTNKEKYIVDNTLYFDNQDVGKKGGYNLPETFGNRYLGMVQKLYQQKFIFDKTYSNIKFGILDFIAQWYLKVRIHPEKYTFSFDNWEKIIFDLYGNEGNEYILSYYKKHRMKSLIKKMLGKY